MKKQYAHKPVTIRFRRWSRKGYAAFISIQHAVTIGQLSANVSERFQVKNGSTHTSVLSSDKTDEEKKEEDSSKTGEISGNNLSLLFDQAYCLIRIINHPAAAHTVPTVKNYISESAEGSQHTAETFRASCLYKHAII